MAKTLKYTIIFVSKRFQECFRYYLTDGKPTGFSIASSKQPGQNAVLSNIYDGQLKKIDAALTTLHEDLQHDYQKEIAALR